MAAIKSLVEMLNCLVPVRFAANHVYPVCVVKLDTTESSLMVEFLAKLEFPELSFSVRLICVVRWSITSSGIDMLTTVKFVTV